MKKVLLSLAISTLAFSANAYQMEAGIHHAHSDVDDATGVFINYHLVDVDTSKGPLNEANFLSKSTFVGAGYTTSDYADLATLQGRFVSNSDWTASLEIMNIDSDFFSATAYGITVGKYLNDHSEVFFSYADSDAKNAKEDIMVGYKSVVNNIAYSGIVSTSDSELKVAANGMYYFSNAFGVGAGLAYDTESKDTDAELMLSYFFTPAIEFEAGYQEKSESIRAGVNFRF